MSTSNFHHIPEFVTAQYPNLNINIYEQFGELMQELKLHKKIRINLENPKIQKHFNILSVVNESEYDMVQEPEPVPSNNSLSNWFRFAYH